MPVPSLMNMATRACIKNVLQITDIGDMQYDLIKPVLRKIENPQQLHEIETNTPSIADSTAHLWRAFIKRDIPKWEEKIMEPKNPRSWWKVYRKLIREEQRAKEEIEARLSAAIADIDEKRGVGKTNYEAVVHKLPAGKKAYVDGNPNPRYNRGSSGVSASTMRKGHDIIKGLRKKAVNPPNTVRPYVPSVRSQITHAPTTMVRDHARPAPLPEARNTGSTTLKTAPLPPLFSASNKYSERENRLRALTNPGAKTASSSSAARERDNDELDLWSPTTKPAQHKSAISPAKKPGQIIRSRQEAPKPLQRAPKSASPPTSTSQASRPTASAPPAADSPAPAMTTITKKRPAGSIFMPAKKRKV